MKPMTLKDSWSAPDLQNTTSLEFHLCPDIGDKEKGQETMRAHTFQRREATVHDQLKIAKLPLGESDGRERIGLRGELFVTRSIAGDQVLEDTAVGWIGHDFECVV